MRGKFIVFEGIDGSGKTSLISLLSEKLRKDGRKICVTAEPTNSVTGGIIRDALSGYVKRSPCELAAMFVSDRIYHNVNQINGIKKMLDDGFDVICDRYYYSSLAYQGSETDFEWVKIMNLDCPEIARPDVCIFVDLDPEVSLERISKGRALTEIYERVDKLTKIRSRYFEVFKLLGDTDNIKIVSNNGKIEDAANEIYSIVMSL